MSVCNFSKKIIFSEFSKVKPPPLVIISCTLQKILLRQNVGYVKRKSCDILVWECGEERQSLNYANATRLLSSKPGLFNFPTLEIHLIVSIVLSSGKSQQFSNRMKCHQDKFLQISKRVTTEGTTG